MIQLEHISKRYVGPSGTVDALKDVSVHVEKGDIYGIIGSSGAGKSTLLRMVNQLEKPDTGTVTVAGRELSTLSKAELRKMRRKIGMVFQQFNLLESKTVFQNVAIPLILEGIPKEKITERVKEVLHIVELHDKRDTYVTQLSGGQKQRVGIARALALEPQIIICDEAVSALDVSVQAQVLNLLQELKEKLGLTYFFISHNLNVVYQVSDRVGVMYLGKMVEIANYDQLYEKRYHPYTEALLSAIPQVDQEEQKERIHLEGEVPSPYDPPSGCHFHTRCPKACDKCRQTAPELKEVAPGHYVACHLYE